MSLMLKISIYRIESIGFYILDDKLMDHPWI